MASRIIKDSCTTEDEYEITAQFTNYRDYKAACDFIKSLNNTITTEPEQQKQLFAEIIKLIDQIDNARQLKIIGNFALAAADTVELKKQILSDYALEYN